MHGARATLIAWLALVLAACVSVPDRPEVPAGAQDSARVDGFGEIRLWEDASAEVWRSWREAMIAQRKQSGPGDRFEMLVISSGSDKGAYSAGFLNGWSQAGTRPEFNLVSGVSTGALIAPFAFLGSDYDPQLRDLYTQINADMIYRTTALKGLLGGTSLASTEPLAELIASYANEALIDAVAAEHRKGRRLLVQTTNLDAERGVVWDMGAIASSDSPARYDLFRKILLGSASIPGFFPPVLIDVQSEALQFAELHVDGGTTSSLVAIPPAVIFSRDEDIIEGRGRITVLYNGALEPVYRVTKPDAFTIMSRALTTALKTADQRSLAALRLYADGNGLKLDIYDAGDAGEDPDVDLFDQEFMRGLYEIGLQEALEAHPAAR
ncbi:MAG: patatin-like phospholipase family protein [Pseudomonadota bacterium]